MFCDSLTVKILTNVFDWSRTWSDADAALQLHADTCTSMDPHLNQVIECLQKMRQQLEQLFQFSRESDTTTDLQLEAIEPIDEFAQSSHSISPETEKETNDLETELPALAPLEVPQFDFSMLPMWTFSKILIILVWMCGLNHGWFQVYQYDSNVLVNINCEYGTKRLTNTRRKVIAYLISNTWYHIKPFFFKDCFFFLFLNIRNQWKLFFFKCSKKNEFTNIRHSARKTKF